MNEEEQHYYQANLAFNTSLDMLAHYGVSGMRWGVRNEDTLRKYNGIRLNRRGSTSRTKRQQNLISRFRNRMSMRKNSRLNKANQQLKSSNQKEASPTLEKIAEIKESGGYKIKEKNPNKLTDAELSSANQRLQAEITYKQRQAQLRDLNLTKRQRRWKNLKNNAIDVGKNVLKGYATKRLTQVLNKSGKTLEKVKDTTTKATDDTKKAVDKAYEKAKDKVDYPFTYEVMSTPISTFTVTASTSDNKKKSK